ncbi:hypothetical protein [Conservatibacter flavescens]|uniref:Uncharacterized protein n=1 Tax=Conservatibacter flavescens TaxID=28161 RepID=A0A2M8S0C9_9PAST|nr:hypothetical protein [Conservatibacter flavescens]PJG84585.1 hypothetical protein CVP05_10630 [Conservatibacter flavescens]
MKNSFCIILILFLLNGCIVIDLMPSYSKTFNEDIWVDKKTGKALSDTDFNQCRHISIIGFKTKKSPSGLTQFLNEKDEQKSNDIYASCLQNKGYIFNASYKYCYKFKSTCEKYNKYRK